MINIQTQIANLEEQLRQAMLQSDADRLDTLIDEKLLFVSPDGQLLSKAQDLENYRSGAQRITRLEVLGQDIRASEGVAIVTVLALIAGDFLGQAFQGRFRYLRVWQQTAGGWRIVAGSVAMLAEP
jgi:ketosteroid isomerase-like protein